MSSQICSIKSVVPDGGKFSCTLPRPPLTRPGSDVSSLSFSTARGLEADPSARPSRAHPKKNEGHFWAGRGGLSPGAAMGRATIPAPRGTRGSPLGPLWANAQAAASGSLSSCLLSLGNSSWISSGIGPGGFKALRDRSLKGLQKPGFSSVGFAAVLVPPGREHGLLWAAQALPRSPATLQPLQQGCDCCGTHSSTGTCPGQLQSWCLSHFPGSGDSGGPRGENHNAPLFHRDHLLQGAGNNFVVERPLELLETKLQKKTSGYAVSNRRIWEKL